MKTYPITRQNSELHIRKGQLIDIRDVEAVCGGQGRSEEDTASGGWITLWIFVGLALVIVLTVGPALLKLGR